MSDASVELLIERMALPAGLHPWERSELVAAIASLLPTLKGIRLARLEWIQKSGP